MLAILASKGTFGVDTKELGEEIEGLGLIDHMNVLLLVAETLVML